MSPNATTRITATGKSFAEAILESMHQAIAQLSKPEVEATIAIPLRARESELVALAEAMLGELLAEIGEGAQIGSVQIDGFMKRDGDWICWGYAFAAEERESSIASALSLREVVVAECERTVEIRFTVVRDDQS